MLMISRMINVVGEQGTYWVANNFIWGWLLLPVLQLGELIKQEVAKDKKAVKNNISGYFVITGITVIIWIIAVPLYKPFMKNILCLPDIDKIFNLIILLLAFYILFAFQNIFDAIFYGRGKTNYMLFESVVTNSVYYGGCYISYTAGWWLPSLERIALMFGFGIAFDTIVSAIAYWHFSKKQSENTEKYS